jgi:thymidine phosphorylase
MRPLNVIDLIATKRDGEQFSDLGLCFFVDSYLSGEISVEAFEVDLASLEPLLPINRLME